MAVRLALARFLIDLVTSIPTTAIMARPPMMIPTSYNSSTGCSDAWTSLTPPNGRPDPPIPPFPVILVAFAALTDDDLLAAEEGTMRPGPETEVRVTTLVDVRGAVDDGDGVGEVEGAVVVVVDVVVGAIEGMVDVDVVEGRAEDEVEVEVEVVVGAVVGIMLEATTELEVTIGATEAREVSMSRSSSWGAH